MIAITHRLSIIAAPDRLAVMDQERIAKEGADDEPIVRGGIMRGPGPVSGAVS